MAKGETPTVHTTPANFAVVPIDDLVPHPDNPNQGDVATIADLIVAHGFLGAVQAQRSTRRIVAGNHRWKAAKRLGITEIGVFWLDIGDTEAERRMLEDNFVSDAGDYVDVMLQAAAWVCNTSQVIDWGKASGSTRGSAKS
jgi:hypothetical protein